MNPIEVSEKLQATFISYLMTAFDVNRAGTEPELAAALQEALDQRSALFKGPYLELTPPYHTDRSLNSLIEEGILSPKLANLDYFQHGGFLKPSTSLYTHQVKAIRRLCKEQKNVVISSGTGSGKTECFLFPIINDLLIDPTPGVRAILIYPMNALVNDQLDRLRKWLQGTGITFGRYTSELAQSSEKAAEEMRREWEAMDEQERKRFSQYPLENEIIGRDQIQKQGQLPQILITNYAMLEYLLLRPDDNPLFTTGKWKYLVLDEAHSYGGSQGLEVGQLIRRLKHRLGCEAGQMRCIATSATLTNNDVPQARAFAEALFGESFDQNSIIFGEINYDYIPKQLRQKSLPATVYTHKDFSDLLKKVRENDPLDDIATLMLDIGLMSEEEIEHTDLPPQAFLWHILKTNQELSNLRTWMIKMGKPLTVTEVAQHVFGEFLSDEHQRNQALYHLIELGALARLSSDDPSLLPARYHLFGRPPQGIWVCLNPHCTHKNPHATEHWSQLWASPRKRCECGCFVYPLTVCRTCGQTYIRAQFDKTEQKYLAETDQLSDANAIYLTWKPIDENRSLKEQQDELDDEDVLLQESSQKYSQDGVDLCLSCQSVVKKGRCECTSPIHIRLQRVTKEEKKGKGTRNIPVESLVECLRCHDVAQKGTEIVTTISLATTTPLSVVSEELYRHLDTSSQESIRAKVGGGRKLLTFYDSRQGAARFAAFLQAATNQRTYRHLIPRILSENRSLILSFNELVEECTKVALRERLFHNDLDVDSEKLSADYSRLSRDERKQLQTIIAKYVFAEFTTQSRSRQSLEQLGLVAVQYCETNLPGLEQLSRKIGLNTTQTQLLVELLLDGLRQSKIVSLPERVNRDDEIFGRNKFTPTLVRGNANYSKQEIPWIGATLRHRRKRLIEGVWRKLGKPIEEATTTKILENIWEWLTRESGLLNQKTGQYQLDHKRLFFQYHENVWWYRCEKCRRISYRGDEFGCQHPHCNGNLIFEEAPQRSDNFYYQRFLQELIPMRVEEHTAQLTSEKGRKYQNDFKRGAINVLSCSTTFEMGIDLGDLQAVVMSNIPPAVANYKQRAGRAGRRASGTAFILTWASERPHDAAYFKMPEEIIGGHIRVPHLSNDNHVIIQRHVNAILLSQYLRHCADPNQSNTFRIGNFFSEYEFENHYFHLNAWLDEKGSELIRLLKEFAQRIDLANPYGNRWVEDEGIGRFVTDMREKGYERYKKSADFYTGRLKQLNDERNELPIRDPKRKTINAEEERFQKLVARLESEELINTLSDWGILPSYSFPLHTVALYVSDESLRLQRDLRQAIREYAPYQEIVADKRIWVSEGLEFFGKEPERKNYRICKHCNRLQLSEQTGEQIEEQCPVCGGIPTSKQLYQFIKPDGFRSDYFASGKPAGQYVNRQSLTTCTALYPREVTMASQGHILAHGYDREGRILYVNEGIKGSGYRICVKCGKALSKKQEKHKYYGTECNGVAIEDKTITLGFDQQTDTLHLEFTPTETVKIPDYDNSAFWLSLKYAIINGASKALQIERTDLGGTLYPKRMQDGSIRQTIVLYDNVPGGAGYVKQIREKIAEVVRTAIEIVDCTCAEDTSCYRCLRDYYNQWEHHLLERGPIKNFLTALSNDLQSGSDQSLVSTTNHPYWLWEQVGKTKRRLILALSDITNELPNGATEGWLDRLQKLLNKGVQVKMGIRSPLRPNRADDQSLIRANHLRLLIDKGLQLFQLESLPEWMINIDDTTMIRPIKPPFTLNAESGSDGLETTMTIHSQPMGIVVTRESLLLPSDIEVKDLKKGDRVTEEKLFASVFARPITELQINDRYLYNERIICDRLGAYIRMAHRQGALKNVNVFTEKAGKSFRVKDHDPSEQARAVTQLTKQFSDVLIDFSYTNATHDRFIIVTYTDKSRSRIVIGKGLDFIDNNGVIGEDTTIVIEQNYKR